MFLWTCVASGRVLWMLNKILLELQRGTCRREKRQRSSLEETGETGNHRGLGKPTAVPHFSAHRHFSRNKSLASQCQGERITVNKYVLLDPGKACLRLPPFASLFWNPKASFCRKQGEITEEILPGWGWLDSLIAYRTCFTGAVMKRGSSPWAPMTRAHLPCALVWAAASLLSLGPDIGFWHQRLREPAVRKVGVHSPPSVSSLFCSSSTFPSLPAPPLGFVSLCDVSQLTEACVYYL